MCIIIIIIVVSLSTHFTLIHKHQPHDDTAEKVSRIHYVGAMTVLNCTELYCTVHKLVPIHEMIHTV